MSAHCGPLMALTDAQRRALLIVRAFGERGCGGAQFGNEMWPAHAEYGRPLRAQGAEFAGGTYLAKLAKAGLVEPITDKHRYCGMYRVSHKGLVALKPTGGE